MCTGSRRTITLSVVTAMALLSSTGVAADPIFVDVSAEDGGDGSTWEAAYNDLSVALAVANREGGADVWVAAGTYVPGEARTDTFLVGENVRLYGSFAGDEAGVDERDLSDGYSTVLSGDIDSNDFTGEGGGLAGNGGNAYNVVTVASASNPVIDGFEVTAGFADGEVQTSHGAGMVVLGGNLTARNLLFSRHYAREAGGAVHVKGDGTVRFEDVDFESNTSGQYGGAVALAGSVVAPFVGCDFEDNTASIYGGAVQIEGQAAPQFDDCFFHENSTNSGGGAVNISTDEAAEAVSFSSSVFSANQSGGPGSAIATMRTGESSRGPGLTVDGSTFVLNGQGGDGGAIYANRLASLVVTDSHFEGNLANRGGAISIIDDATTTIVDTTFKNNSAALGGSVHYTRSQDPGPAGSIELERVTFDFSTATDGPGGGVFAEGFAEFTATDIDLADCTAASPGGGIYLYSAPFEGERVVEALSASVTISRAGFFRDRTQSVGGGLYADAASITIDDATFVGNESSSPGGGAYVQGQVLVLSALTFEQNRCTSSVGGGLYVGKSQSLPSAVTLSDASFVGNECVNPGGGAYVDAGTFDGSDLTFDGNESRGGTGGGLSLNLTGEGTVTRAAFRGNRSHDPGGGLYAYGPEKITITHTTFEDNHTAIHGGGFYVQSDLEVSVSETILLRNEADQLGGGLWAGAPVIGLTNVLVAENRARGTASQTARGGGVYLHAQYSEVVSVQPVRITHCTIAHNSASHGASDLLLAADRLIVENSIIAPIDSDVPHTEQESDWPSPVVEIHSSRVPAAGFGAAITLEGDTPFDDDVGFLSTESSDYRLAALSALVDRGDGEFAKELQTDVIGNDRTIGGGPDLGAFEYACNNRGIATVGVCRCIDGFSGPGCERCDPDDPAVDCSDYCNANGDHVDGACVCDVNWREPVCDTCATGWSGDSCDVCSPDEVDCTRYCNGNGSYEGGGQCRCDDWFDGDQCEMCADRRDGLECSDCVTGYAGDDCAECAPHYAGEECATCALGWAGAGCDSCDEGFAGDDCDECAQGWSGRQCETPPVETPDSVEPEPDVSEPVPDAGEPDTPDAGGDSDLVDLSGSDDVVSIQRVDVVEGAGDGSSGCGCAVGRTPDRPSGLILALLALGVLASRRR